MPDIQSTTVGELKDILSRYNDNDVVVVEIHEGERTEDLYNFYVDAIPGIKLEDGSEITEVRICI